MSKNQRSRLGALVVFGFCAVIAELHGYAFLSLLTFIACAMMAWAFQEAE